MAEEKYSQDAAAKEENRSRCKIFRCERLKSREKISFTLKNGAYFKYKNIIVSHLSQDRWEFAILISRGLKGAINRNRIKRIIREAYRTAKPLIDEPSALIFRVHNPATQISFKELQNQLAQALM